jgi:hypothetical protein
MVKTDYICGNTDKDTDLLNRCNEWHPKYFGVFVNIDSICDTCMFCYDLESYARILEIREHFRLADEKEARIKEIEELKKQAYLGYGKH